MALTTKEGAVLPWLEDGPPTGADDAYGKTALETMDAEARVQAARAALAAEWRAADPQTADDVAALWEVLPRAMSDDEQNGAGAHPIQTAKRTRAIGPRPAHIVCTYRQHILGRELGTSLTLTVRDAIGMMSCPVRGTPRSLA